VCSACEGDDGRDRNATKHRDICEEYFMDNDDDCLAWLLGSSTATHTIRPYQHLFVLQHSDTIENVQIVCFTSRFLIHARTLPMTPAPKPTLWLWTTICALTTQAIY
jgi:hypothetical protein